MDLLTAVTGIKVEGNTKESEGRTVVDQLCEEVTFEQFFYIYGGPEQLEELEALSNHYALLSNRRKAKLSTERKTIYDGKLKDVHRVFDLGTELDGNSTDSGKGKKVEAETDDSFDELKNLHDSSVRKAAELSAGFASSLAGLASKEHISFIRLNHYPPCLVPHLVLGVGRHKDGCALTILAQDDLEDSK